MSRSSIRHLNVVLTELCNAKCSFCFARDSQATGREMEPREIDTLLRFCERNNVQSIGILGGEPLLSDSLPEILTRTRDLACSKGTTVFTNGQAKSSVLDRLAHPDYWRGVGVLFNLSASRNHRDADKLADVHDLVQDYGAHTNLGITIATEDADWSLLSDTLDRVSKRPLRISLALRTDASWTEAEWDAYFGGLLASLESLLDLALERGIPLHSDCAMVPICLSSDSLTRKLLTLLPGAIVGRPCSPTLDVEPNLRVLRCFMHPNISVSMEDLSDYESIMSILDSTHWNLTNGKYLWSRCRRCPYGTKYGRTCICTGLSPWQSSDMRAV